MNTLKEFQRKMAIYDKWQHESATYWLRTPDGWHRMELENATLVHITLRDVTKPDAPPLRLNLRQRDAMLATKELVIVPTTLVCFSKHQAQAIRSLLGYAGERGELERLLNRIPRNNAQATVVAGLLADYKGIDPQLT